MKKIRLLFAAAMLATAGFAAGVTTIALQSEATPVYAEAVEATQEEPKKESSNWIEEKIVPIVGAFSVGNFFAGAIAITTAITKLRSDKTLKRKYDEQQARLTALEERIRLLSEKDESMGQVFEQAQSAITSLRDAQEETLKTLREQNKKVMEVISLKDTLEGMCTLIERAFSLSDSAVKSGVAKEAKRLVSSMRHGGGSDGQE